MILVLILLVFISPLIKGAVGGVLGFIVALALLPFLVVFGIGAAVVGLFVAAVAVIGAGIGTYLQHFRLVSFSLELVCSCLHWHLLVLCS